MTILSQAAVGNDPAEGAETTTVSPNNNLSHERPTLDKTFQICCTSSSEDFMPKGRVWSDEEMKFLEENYEQFGVAYCARHLGRTASAVKHHASRLELRRRGEHRMARVLIKDGYIWISENDNQFALHRRIVEDVLQRKLEAGEVVHHIDENRMNNHPSNLQVLSIAEHNYQVHPKNRDTSGRFCQVDDIVRASGKPEEMKDKEPS